MNNTGVEILKILSDSLNNNAIGNIDNWAGVLDELKEQAVFCLPYKVIRSSG